MITPLSKGPTRKQLKAKRDRAEIKVRRDVRAKCVARDGHCFIGTRLDVDVELGGYMQNCAYGSGQWAHLASHRRSKTRGQAPELRHDTRYSAIACPRHHRLEESGVIEWVPLTEAGMDGPVLVRLRESKVKR